MVETKIVVDGLTLSYEGLFSATEFYMMIDRFFRDHMYDKRETQNLEKVEPQGKYIELELQPYRKMSDYIRFVIRMRLRMFNVTEVEIEKDGHKVKLNKGRVNMVFDGFLETDYEGRWEGKPSYVFIRTVFDKFIYKMYTQKFEAQLTEDVNTLYNQLKAFLNLYRY